MSITITPIGGLGQIGGNSCLIEHKDVSILIDYGILFPYDDCFGINYLIPNINQIESKLDYLIITHGHEDHIGGVPHILEKFPHIKIIAPPFAAELIRKKCHFWHKNLTPDICEDIDQTFDLSNSTKDELKIDYIQVNHSIPDTYGILIREPKADAATFFISDFKIDDTGYFESPFDFQKLKKLSSKLNSRLLMADSTNILSSHLETPSEKSLCKDIDNILSQDNNRIIVTTFSSNISRIQTLVDCAKKNKRKVVLYGRSMWRYCEIARDTGFASFYDDLKDIDQVNLDSERLLIIVSGCQADFRSTFRRVAYGVDGKLKLGRNDVVALSSKTIPGNEKAIAMSLNEISAQGAEIITAQDAHIHVSGHAGRNDILKVFDEYNPTHHIPIHGETYFLRKHAKHIKEKTTSKVKFVTNFSSIQYPSFKEFDQYREEEYVLVHGKGLSISRDVIKERRKVSTNGLVIISKARTNIEVELVGIQYNDEDHRESIINQLKSEVSRSKSNNELIKMNCRRIVNHIYGIKPEVRIIEHNT